MRELTTTELRQTSGGLFGLVLAPVGALIGYVTGEVVDESLNRYGGYQTNFASSGASLGAGIASLIGLSPVLTLVFMREGIQGIVQNGFEIARQVKAQKQTQ